jgi:hypothetical protein
VVEIFSFLSESLQFGFLYLPRHMNLTCMQRYLKACVKYLRSMKEISLTRGKIAIVDDEDFFRLTLFKWHAKRDCNTYYAARWDYSISPPQYIRMHRLILNASVGTEIDHINGNGLDNRRENIRFVTRRENQQNLHIQKSSCFPGVSWNTHRKVWVSFIKIGKQKKYLGSFENEIDAAQSYLDACKNL